MICIPYHCSGIQAWLRKCWSEMMTEILEQPAGSLDGTSLEQLAELIHHKLGKKMSTLLLASLDLGDWWGLGTGDWGPGTIIHYQLCQELLLLMLIAKSYFCCSSKNDSKNDKMNDNLLLLWTRRQGGVYERAKGGVEFCSTHTGGTLILFFA